MNYKHTTLLAAIVLMGLTIFASCKKDNETKAPEANNIQCASITHPEQIDDMNAYLEQFKQQLMGDSKGDEMMTVEDANWFLTNLSNYDFGNVVEQFDDIMFDDIYTDVNISNGMVSLADLNDAYKQIFNEIRSYYRNLDLQDKDFRFIKCEIQEDGAVKTHVTVTYGNGEKAFGGFHFSSEDNCIQLLNPDLTYTPFDVAISELVRILSHEYGIDNSYCRIYFTFDHDITWNPRNAPTDPNSPFLNSRLYFTNGYFWPLTDEEMAYLVDSYAGLIDDGLTGNGIVLVSLTIEEWDYSQKEEMAKGHKLLIGYGNANASIHNPALD